MKEISARHCIAIFALSLTILALDLLVGAAWPAEPASSVPPSPRVSAFLIRQCGNIVGVTFVDDHGMLHPVPPEALNEQTVNPLLTLIPPERRIVATVKCNGTESDI